MSYRLIIKLPIGKQS